MATFNANVLELTDVGNVNIKKRRELEELRKVEAQRKKLRQRMGAVLVVAILVTLIGVYILTRESNNSTASQINLSSIPWGKFIKVSNSNSTEGIAIYYISWLGCPIGATNSWAFYKAISDYGNISNYISYHYSNSTDSYPNTPGMVFKAFNIRNISFKPTYVYGQGFDTALNGSAFKATPLSYGMGILKNALPANIYSLEQECLEKIPLTSQGTPSAYLGSIPHVNTNVFIVNSGGTYLLNGPLFSPQDLSNLTTSSVMASLNSNQYVINSAQHITTLI